MALRFWLKVLFLSECNDSSRVIICTQAGGRWGGWLHWLPFDKPDPGRGERAVITVSFSLSAVLHADEADNLLPFLTLETQTGSCAAPLLFLDLQNQSEYSARQNCRTSFLPVVSCARPGHSSGCFCLAPGIESLKEEKKR